MADEGCLYRFLSLPDEVLCLVFQQEVLKIPDLYRIGGVCTRFRSIVSGMWSFIAKQRWCYWGEFSDCSDREIWKTLCRERFCLEHMLTEALTWFSQECVRMDCVSDSYVARILPNGINKPVINEPLARLILSQDVEQKHESADLTRQHYAVFLYEYLLRKQALSSLKAHLSKRKNQWSLDTCASLFAAYLFPYAGYTEESVTSTLDALAEDVAQCVLRKHFKEVDKLADLGDPPYLPRVKVFVDDQIKICEAINEVLYTVHGFRGNSEDYYNINNSLIHEVLQSKCGIPITLCIVYSGVARRLGVHLELVSSPTHFLLRMRCDPADVDKEKYNPIDDKNRYIDAFNTGTILTAMAALDRIGGIQILRTWVHPFNVTRPLEVLYRMGLNVISGGQSQFAVDDMYFHRQFDVDKRRWTVPCGHASLKFLLDVALLPLNRADAIDMVFGGYINTVVNACLHQKYEIDKVEDVLHAFSPKRLDFDIDPDYLEESGPLAVKKREPEIQFHVGTIMYHKRFNYYGVISGWDQKCEMPLDWVIQMGVNHLRGGPRQPFYNVLVEDRTTRYVAQENVTIPKSENCRPILHFSVGKYFVSFKGDHYEPNDVLKAAYPEDQYCVSNYPEKMQ